MKEKIRFIKSVHECDTATAVIVMIVATFQRWNLRRKGIEPITGTAGDGGFNS